MYEQFLAYFTIDNGLFLTIGLLGMLGHGIKKYYADELNGNIVDYFFKNNKKRTILTILSTVGALIGVILGEQVPTQIGAFIMLAFTTGFTADSTVNREDEN